MCPSQVVCGCGGVDVLLDLLTTGSSEQVQAAAAAALRDLLVWPKAQASPEGRRMYPAMLHSKDLQRLCCPRDVQCPSISPDRRSALRPYT
jgi:hypothetical protein